MDTKTKLPALPAQETRLYSTGLLNLDRMLGFGLMRGGLYILAGRPGIGSSSLLLSMAEGVKHALFVSFEATPTQICARRIAARADVDSAHIISGAPLTEAEATRVTMAAAVLRKSGMSFSSAADMDTADVLDLARRIHGLRGIFIDPLSMLLVRGAKDREAMAYSIGTDLKRIARGLDVPVVATLPLPRTEDQRDDPKRMLSDFGAFVPIEQFADAVLLLQRTVYSDAQVQQIELLSQPSLIECVSVKNRYAGLGKASFALQSETGRIEEV